MSETFFVLGNGKSRLAVDLPSLKEHGKIFGCNALYRDFMPDCLVSVDARMVNEVVRNKVHKQIPVWTNYSVKYEQYPELNMIRPTKGWSSGPTALWLAATQQPKEIYILGFDYSGDNGKINNVYSSTPNYKKSEEKAIFYGNWVKQTESVIRDFPRVKFIRLVNDNCLDVRWLQYRNFETMTYDVFKSRFNA